MSTEQAQETHPALRAVAAIDMALDDLLAASLWSLTDAQEVDLIGAQNKVAARLSAAILATTRDLDARGTAAAQGATGTGAWLREKFNLGHGEAHRRVKLGKALDADHPEVAAALAAGTISEAHAQVIATAMRQLPKDLDAATRKVTEEQLLGLAATLDPDALRKFGAHLREVLDPDGTEPRERDAVSQRTLSFTDRGDGTQRISGILDTLAAATLKAGIDPLAAPRPAADGTQDPRTPGRRRADALMDLVEQALRHGALPKARGARPHLIITAGLDTLMKLKGAPPATTASGETVSAETLRRIACDAGVTRILTDPEGLPLDVGREYRSVPQWLWVALVNRDKGCTFPGCTRPASWTQAHHLIFWGDDGITSLDTCALLCDPHHDEGHHHGWGCRLGQDRRPEFLPPAWIDSERKPRRNTY